MKGYGQKIDRSAGTQLIESARLYPENWGRAEVREGMLVYEDLSGETEKITVAYEAKKQLLGGVFSLIFSGESDCSLLGCEGEAEMFYSGRFIKGEAYFKEKNGEGRVAEILNGMPELIGLLSQLDLLALTVSCHDHKLVCRLSPLGGAYTYTVFPPVKYGGILPQRDIEAIGRSMELIAGGFKCAEMAAGAE